MLTAKQVQDMLGVPDDENIAYGYTFARKTVEIWFSEGLLIREDYSGDNFERRQSERREWHEFAPSYFLADIKRFYTSKTNPKLIELFATFGTELPLTP